MRGIATKQYCNTTARSDNEAVVPFAAQRSRHRIDASALSLRLKGSINPAFAVAPGIWIGSPTAIYRGWGPSILYRREVISFQTEPRLKKKPLGPGGGQGVVSSMVHNLLHRLQISDLSQTRLIRGT